MSNGSTQDQDFAQASNAGSADRESRFDARAPSRDRAPGRAQSRAAGDSVCPVPAVSVRILITPSSDEIEALAKVFDRYRAHYGEPSDGSPSRPWLARSLGTGQLRAFVAEDGAEMVGFATAMEVPASLRLAHFWHVRDLFVLPTHRRLGVARALLASIRAAALDAGALRLLLQTEDDNEPALRLYEASGYTVVRGYCSLILPLAPNKNAAPAYYGS